MFEPAGISFGASALWSGLNDVDGVDLLYAGRRRHQSARRRARRAARVLKEWTGASAVEAIVLQIDSG